MSDEVDKWLVGKVVLTGEQLEAMADVLVPPAPASHTLVVRQTFTKSGGRHTYAHVMTASGKVREQLHVSKDGGVTMVDQGDCT